jgi:hypothetical protein
MTRGSFLFTDRDKMYNHYRGHSIDASYKVSVHLAQQFQRRNIFRNRPIRNMNCLWWPCLLTDQDKRSNLYRGPSIDASYQSFHSIGKAGSEEKIFTNRPIRNKNCLWLPCLLMDRDEMCNIYRGPSIDACYNDSVHLAKRFQRGRFLEIDQSEKIITCGSHVC